jgi:prepilin-type N-terminal cleavage/methylation domain-containing protein
MVNTKRCKQGFTLIELIVVIAILSVLTAILIPTISSYIDNAKVSTDLANVKALNNITALYRVDALSSDPFMDETKNSEYLMQELVSSGYLNNVLQPQVEDAEFIWQWSNQLWVYQNSIIQDNPISVYLLTTSDYTLGWSPFVIGDYTNEIEKNIRIPDGFTTIKGGLGVSAFFEKDLQSVVLPDSLRNIYSHAFYGNDITEISIPQNVIFIGTHAFYNNPITKITMASDPSLVVIQDRVFGIGYSESQTITNLFKTAYTNGGAGTYEWIDGQWIKTE